MIGSVISRFRVLILLLAFGLGLAGQLLSGAAMAAQMQAGAEPGITTGMDCPACPSDHGGGMMGSCSVAACWTIPALPTYERIPERPGSQAFVPSVALVIAGIATAPEPHPPRLLLHAN